MVVQIDVPGLRENIIRQAQERRIELSVQEGSEEEINEPSDQGSNWDPEEEAFGDNAQGGCKSAEASRHMKGTMAHWSVPQALQWQHLGTRKKRPLRTQAEHLVRCLKISFLHFFYWFHFQVSLLHQILQP